MEYISKAFPQINDRNAKNIVLHLTKHREREFTRKEILDGLKLEMSDSDLEKKLKALVMADIINQGSNDFRYRGVNDTIFDKVFRGVYQEEIDGFDVSIIAKEYRTRFEDLKKQYHRLLGEFNYRKGYLFFPEVGLLPKRKNTAKRKGLPAAKTKDGLNRRVWPSAPFLKDGRRVSRSQIWCRTSAGPVNFIIS